MYTKDRNSAGTDEKVTNWTNWRIERWRIIQILLYKIRHKTTRRRLRTKSCYAAYFSIHKDNLESLDHLFPLENHPELSCLLVWFRLFLVFVEECARCFSCFHLCYYRGCMLILYDVLHV